MSWDSENPTNYISHTSEKVIPFRGRRQGRQPLNIYMLICCDFSKWCICFLYMFWYDLVCHMSNIIIIVVVLLLIVIVIIITVFVVHAPAPKWSWNQLFLCTQLPRPLSSPWAFLVVGPWLRTVPGVPRFSAPFQTIRNAFRNERYMHGVGIRKMIVEGFCRFTTSLEGFYFSPFLGLAWIMECQCTSSNN